MNVFTYFCSNKEQNANVQKSLSFFEVLIVLIVNVYSLFTILSQRKKSFSKN